MDGKIDFHIASNGLCNWHDVFIRLINNLISGLHPFSDHLKPHGRAWKIHKRELLISEVVPKYFSHRKFESFTRQLNGWGFKCLHQAAKWLQRIYPHMFSKRSLAFDRNDEVGEAVSGKAAPARRRRAQLLQIWQTVSTVPSNDAMSESIPMPFISHGSTCGLWGSKESSSWSSHQPLPVFFLSRSLWPPIAFAWSSTAFLWSLWWPICVGSLPSDGRLSTLPSPLSYGIWPPTLHAKLLLLLPSRSSAFHVS